jgi:hypothetical protein
MSKAIYVVVEKGADFITHCIEKGFINDYRIKPEARYCYLGFNDCTVLVIEKAEPGLAQATSHLLVNICSNGYKLGVTMVYTPAQVSIKDKFGTYHEYSLDDPAIINVFLIAAKFHQKY